MDLCGFFLAVIDPNSFGLVFSNMDFIYLHMNIISLSWKVFSLKQFYKNFFSAFKIAPFQFHFLLAEKKFCASQLQMLTLKFQAF